jgi:predicted RNA-binding protein with TRAM domain
MSGTLRFIATSLVFFVLFSAVPAGAQDQCEREVDEFADKASISCPAVDVETKKTPGPRVFGAKAFLLSSEGIPFLILRVISNSEQFDSVNEGYALVDGENYKFGIDRLRHVGSGIASTEELALQLSSTFLNSYSTGKNVRVRVEGVIFDVGSDSLRMQAKEVRRMLDSP